MTRQMQEEDIATFVSEIMEAGFRMVVIGTRHYIIDDSHLSKSRKVEARKRLASIREVFGHPDHLRGEIARHLHELGQAIGL